MLELPLSSLRIGAANVRHANEMDDNLKTLMASIASVGLLQPLVVAPADDGGFEVIAGRRRFTALTVLNEEGKLGCDTVPCFEVPAEAAAEASLAENYVREQMQTKDLYAAFKRMLDGNKTPDDIAAAFGFEVVRVSRILRLANLAPEIMEAWNAGKISDGYAQAYAFTEDHEVQLAVFNGGYQYSPDAVRRSIAKLVAGEVDDRKAKFVGLEAYEAAGGKVLRDLFTDNIQFLDSALLETLYAEKVEKLINGLLENARHEDGTPLTAERVDEPPKINRYGYDETDRDLKVQPVKIRTEADEKRIAEIEDRLLEIESERDEISHDPESYDENDEYSEEAAAAEKKLDDEEDALNYESAEIEARAELRIPNGAAKIVAYPVVYGDRVEIELYYASRDEAGLPSVKSHTTKAASVGGQSVQQKSLGVLAKETTGAPSRNAFMALQVMFADAVAAGLLEDAKHGTEAAATKGLDVFLFVVARTVTDTVHTAGLPRFHEPERAPYQAHELLGKPDKRLGPKIGDPAWLTEPNLPLAYDGFKAWITDTTRAMLGAALLGRLWSPVVNNFAEQPKPEIVRLVAEDSLSVFSQVEWAAQLGPRLELAVKDLMTHKARIATMESWGVPKESLAPLKKATSADFMLGVMNDENKRKLLGLDEETCATIAAWLPAELEIPTVDRPKPKAEAKPKAKKKGAAKKEKELVDA